MNAEEIFCLDLDRVIPRQRSKGESYEEMIAQVVRQRNLFIHSPPTRSYMSGGVVHSLDMDAPHFTEQLSRLLEAVEDAKSESLQQPALREYDAESAIRERLLTIMQQRDPRLSRRVDELMQLVEEDEDETMSDASLIHFLTFLLSYPQMPKPRMSIGYDGNVGADWNVEAGILTMQFKPDGKVSHVGIPRKASVESFKGDSSTWDSVLEDITEHVEGWFRVCYP